MDGLEGLVYREALKKEVRLLRNIMWDECMKVKASDIVQNRCNDAAHGGHIIADLDAN